MKLIVSKSLWGVDLSNSSEWDAIFQKIKADGYSAIETIPLVYQPNPELFRELVDKYGGYIEHGDYVYCSSCILQDHISSFRELLQSALEMGANIVNCHSGHDSWDDDTAVLYFKAALSAERELLVDSYADTVVVHETHRQRLLYSPYQARSLLQHDELRELKINADLSHWVAVCEHVFEAGTARDSWWPAVLDLTAKHCHLIHARVGHAEGPQVYDPRAKEWTIEADAHLSWWEYIWRVQMDRGDTVSIIGPEHGPPPYQIYDTVSNARHTQHSLTQSEKDDILWDINNFIAKLVRGRFSSVNPTPSNIA